MHYIIDSSFLLNCCRNFLHVQLFDNYLSTNLQNHQVILFDFAEHEWIRTLYHQFPFPVRSNISNYMAQRKAAEAILLRFYAMTSFHHGIIRRYGTGHIISQPGFWSKIKTILTSRLSATVLVTVGTRILQPFDAMCLACVQYCSDPANPGALGNPAQVTLVTRDPLLRAVAHTYGIACLDTIP